jgi:hypothetical protein
MSALVREDYPAFLVATLEDGVRSNVVEIQVTSYSKTSHTIQHEGDREVLGKGLDHYTDVG